MKSPSKLFVFLTSLIVVGLLGAELYVRAFSPRKVKPAVYNADSGKVSFSSTWKTAQNLDLAATLPVAHLGRVKPLDSVARHALTVLSETQSFTDFDGSTKRPALLWLLDVASGSSSADGHRIFKIQNLDLLRKFGLEPRPGDFRYSLEELQPHLAEVEKEYPEVSAIKSNRRNPYQNAVMNLSTKVSLYFTLRNSFGFVQDTQGLDLAAYKEAASSLKKNPDAPFIVPVTTDRHWQILPLAQIDGISRQKYDPSSEAWFELLTQHQLLRSLDFAEHQIFLATLPKDALEAKQRKAPGAEDLASARRVVDMFKDLRQKKDAAEAFNAALPRILEAAAAACKVHQERITKRLAEIDAELPAARAAAAGGDVAAASEKLTLLRSEKQTLGKDADIWIRAPSIVPHEATINRAALNIQCIVWYFIALIIALLGWLIWRPHLRVIALSILWATFALHTATLILRIWISGYPPVTNLYSSAVFIGWAVVLGALILEHFWRANAATAVAALVGAMTLLIAQFLSLDGETMKQLMPVLDTKFWLATHVVCITLGYAATFLAGGIGVMWVLMALFDRAGKRSADLDKGFSGGIYGVTCFAMFFSLVGTVLGGLWADDSWGRFWGWDPKENGALLIVIANAILLHCRWSRLVSLRGLAVLAIFGNIVTAWSWFGTNLLGAGLHSYGFTEEGALYLGLFMVSQLLVMGLAIFVRKNPGKAEAK